MNIVTTTVWLLLDKNDDIKNILQILQKASN